MALKPHIVHVVGHTEAHHAATAEDVYRRLQDRPPCDRERPAGAPDMRLDPHVQQRVKELVAEAQITLDAIRRLGRAGCRRSLHRARHAGACRNSPASWTRPHLRNNPYARGQIVTRIDRRGACVAVETVNGRPLSETERLTGLHQHLN